MGIDMLFGAMDRFGQAHEKWWAWSAMLGKALTDLRAYPDHRPGNIELISNIRGAFAELMIVRALMNREYNDEADIAIASIFNRKGAQKSTDLPGVDVKSFGMESNKNFIAVSERGHRKVNGAAEHYVFVLAPLYGYDHFVSAPVAYADVTGWPTKDFPYGHPAHALLLPQFLHRYCQGLKGRRSELVTPPMPYYRVCDAIRDDDVRDELGYRVPEMAESLEFQHGEPEHWLPQPPRIKAVK